VLHELRWARTIRSIDPLGFAGSVVTYPLPFALAAALLRGFDALSSGTLLATVLCRLALQWQVDRALRISTRRWLLGPLRDALSLLVFAASFMTGAVTWRGHRYRIRSDGTMEELKGLHS
jgi:ceramide glucosyltransferase